MKNLLSLILVCLLISPPTALAGPKCNGKFINPIKDVCWSCVFPVSIGNKRFKFGSNSNRPDTDNPSNIICRCAGNIIPIGITIGFWEPVRLVDVTRKAFCLVNMGGISIGYDRYQGNFNKNYEEEEHNQHSFYHTHLYVYPLIAWLKLITDLGCLTKGETMDLAYMSEFDPTYKNDSNFLNPEVFLFANPLAQAACSADCISSTTWLPQEGLFWCAGCFGSMYPFSGNVSSHIGGVQASSLIAIRTLAKLHRVGLAKKTATSDGSIDGELCKNSFAPKIIKSQYRLQMTYPIPATKGLFTCNTLGKSDALYNTGKEFPYKGEDFGYLVWRKKNCCFL